MLKYIILLLLPIPGFAQNKLTAIIKNEATHEALPGATVIIKSLKLKAVANDAGLIIINNIPGGKQNLEVTNTGYKDLERTFNFPVSSADTIEFLLEINESDLDEITVTTTRAGRSINNTATRVEVLAAEEIHEESTMRPGDIRMLLAESTGIQTQQTSATSGNASIRIQGLDGRYTQILKDGFPLYAGAANGLGLLQTPPLDLRQVEIIKGSSSTLYGGGAIAGLINLITKVPSEKRELNFHLNATTAGGLDINSFYGQKWKTAGVTLFASRNTNKDYDPAHIFFTAIPKFERYTFNPKLFLYLDKRNTLSAGINSTLEDRFGGDINFINGKGDSTHSYFEKNKTNRLSALLTFNHTFNANSSFQVKHSTGYFNRIIYSNNYVFNGTQYSTFTEATYLNKREETDCVAGVNVLTDDFSEKNVNTSTLRDYKQTTLGGFIQNTSNITDWLTLETGLRGDYVKNYGFALLPRISALFKIADGLSSRIGGGFGYKSPTIFTEESERILYKNVLPINSSYNRLERSYGVNADINYKKVFDEISLSFNQFFFYTYLNHPLTLINLPANKYKFQNINGHIDSKGAETNVRLAYDELALYLGYTYTNAKIHNDNTVKQNPLTPKHRFNAALVYEIEGKWRFGSELYYFGKQELTDGSEGKDYWLTGLVAERQWKHLSCYINFENIGDVRQTKFSPIYDGSITNPVFRDVYAPLEGFVANGGIILKL